MRAIGFSIVRNVEDLIQCCVVFDGSKVVKIDVTILADQPRYVIRELLMAIWRGQDWPMQAMGYDQWELLAEMLSGCGKDSSGSSFKHTFPGSVLAEAGEGRLLLTRLGC